MAYGDRTFFFFFHYHLWRCTCHCLGETSRYISPHLINVQGQRSMQIAVLGRREKRLHAGSCIQSKIQLDEQTDFHMMDLGLPAMDLPAEHITPAVTFSQWLWKWKLWHKSEPAGRPGAGICCELSDAVRGNSDWWKIRKTDCTGWWTAVSQINLAISDPAKLTTASAERLLFQTLVVIPPPSRMLVRCQLRAETPRAPPCKEGYVWNDVETSRPNNKIDKSLNNTEVCSILWICLQNSCTCSKAQFCKNTWCIRLMGSCAQLFQTLLVFGLI